MNSLLEYYKLKQKYTENIKKRNATIKKNEGLTLKEKQTAIKKIIGKCVNCGRTGGTIFEERNSMLKAVCGSQTPCNLNINIRRKYYDNANALEQSYEKNIENLKMRIIITKLDYLFGINTTKDDIVDKFNKLKSELAHISEAQLILMKKYGDIISGIPSDPLLNDAQMDLANEIAEMKKIYDEYLADPAHADAYITSMIEKYITIIKPLTEKLRNMNYGYYVLEGGITTENRINTEDEDSGDEDTGTGTGTKGDASNIYTLIAKPYRVEQMEQERQ
jgi:hypothetical protein